VSAGPVEEVEIKLLPAGRLPGIDGGLSVALFIPHSRADRFGFGGSSTGVSLLTGSGGRTGSEGGSMLGCRLRREMPFGADMDDRRANLPFSLSCSLFTFFSGRGGRLAGSYSGARTRFFEPPGLLELMLKLVLVETPDIDERPDAIEEIDSLDCFLVKLCSEGLLGGRGGIGLPDEGCEGRRGGNVGEGSDFSHFLNVGAGSTPLDEGVGNCGPAGWFPIVLADAAPLLNSGGLFVLCGLFGNGGGGGFAFLPTA
jgi:hypothetical protein